MKAVVVSEPMKFGVATVPQPSCGAGEVLIRTSHCGICGTDLEILRGTMPRGFVRYPLIPGHEWTGTVVETGAGVDNCKPGDRVSVEGYLTCGKCFYCRMGATNLCTTHEQMGLTHSGGFAEYVAAPGRSCHRLPDHVTLEEAVLVEPAATVVRAIGRVQFKPGYAVAVIGCGTIGEITMRVLSLYRPSSVLAIDLSEGQRSLAMRAGATLFTSTSDAKELIDLSGTEGWDVVINCAGGTGALDLALTIVRRGGNVVAIGAAHGEERLATDANLLVMKDLRIDGVCGYTTQSWVQTLELIASGKLQLRDLVTHTRPLDEFLEALRLLESRTEPVGKIVVRCA